MKKKMNMRQFSYKLWFYEDQLSYPNGIATVFEIPNLDPFLGSFEVSPSSEPSCDFDLLIAHEGYLSMIRVYLRGDTVLLSKCPTPEGSINFLSISEGYVSLYDTSVLYSIDFNSGLLKTGKHPHPFTRQVNLRSCVVLINAANLVQIYIKSSAVFESTGIHGEGFEIAYEWNGVVLLGVKLVYYYFDVSEGKLKRPISQRKCRIPEVVFTTSWHLLEYDFVESYPRLILRDAFFKASLKHKSRSVFHSQEGEFEGSFGLGGLQNYDFSLTRRGSLHLITHDAPIKCQLFENSSLLELRAPLLIELELDYLRRNNQNLLFWDGQSLETLHGIQHPLSNLLLVFPFSITKPLSEFSKGCFQVISIEAHSALFLKPNVDLRILSCLQHNVLFTKIDASNQLSGFDSFYLLSLDRPSQSLITERLNLTALLSQGQKMRGFVEVQHQKFILCSKSSFELVFHPFPLNEEKDIVIRLPQFEDIRLFSAFGGKCLMEIELTNQAPRYLSIEFLHFSKRPDIKLRLTLNAMEYHIPSRAQGLPLLLPMSTEHYECEVNSASLSDLVNCYPYLKTHGFDFQFLKGQEYQRELKAREEREQREQLQREGSSQKENVKSRLRRLRTRKESSTRSATAYIHEILKIRSQAETAVAGFELDSLILVYLAEPYSFRQLEEALNRENLILQIAKKMRGNENNSLLFIFENSIEALHQEAKSLEISLNWFYEKALEEIETVRTHAPVSEVGFESNQQDLRRFKEHLEERSPDEEHEVKIFRSVLRFPPSNHPATLQLFKYFTGTYDPAIFDRKFVQVFIQKRWEDSRWYFGLEAGFLLLGLFFIFIHASLDLSSVFIVPLFLIQAWNLTIEVIEMSQKKRLYFSDFWNWFDLLRFVFCFLYFGVAVSVPHYEQLNQLFLTLLSLFHSVKAFSIFSLFKSTRVLLRIVIEIVKDMIPFFLFVCATNLVVSLLFTSSTPLHELTPSTYPSYLMHVFLLDFGDFSIEEYSVLQDFIFLLAAIVVPLVLLNMLIAIMGDTFDRVKEEGARRELMELAGLVYRYEIVAKALCCFLKSKEKWKYIFYSRGARQNWEDGSLTWEGGTREIKRDLHKLSQLQQEQHEEWARQEKEEQKRVQAQQRRIEELLEESEEWQNRMEEKLLADKKGGELELEECSVTNWFQVEKQED